MAKTRVDADGTDERIFCDPIEIIVRMKIDVSDEPEELTEKSAAFLRRLISEDETEQAVATEDIVHALAMRCDIIGGCDSCDGETLDALDNLCEICAVDFLPDEETYALATEHHYAEDCRKRKLNRG